MPFSLRLDEVTERRIRRLAAATGQTKSQVVREAIAVYGAEHEQREAEGQSAYDKLTDLIGTADSGGQQLSTRTGGRFRELLETKARGRRSR